MGYAQSVLLYHPRAKEVADKITMNYGGDFVIAPYDLDRGLFLFHLGVLEQPGSLSKNAGSMLYLFEKLGFQGQCPTTARNFSLVQDMVNKRPVIGTVPPRHACSRLWIFAGIILSPDSTKDFFVPTSPD